MNFPFFRDFYGIFFNLKSFKIIIKIKKGVLFRAGPAWMQRGTRATWQSHAGPRECLRGAWVTHGPYLYLYIYIYIYIYI